MRTAMAPVTGTNTSPAPIPRIPARSCALRPTRSPLKSSQDCVNPLAERHRQALPHRALHLPLQPELDSGFHEYRQRQRHGVSRHGRRQSPILSGPRHSVTPCRSSGGSWRRIPKGCAATLLVHTGSCAYPFVIPGRGGESICGAKDWAKVSVQGVDPDILEGAFAAAAFPIYPVPESVRARSNWPPGGKCR